MFQTVEEVEERREGKGGCHSYSRLIGIPRGW